MSLRRSAEMPHALLDSLPGSHAAHVLVTYHEASTRVDNSTSTRMPRSADLSPSSDQQGRCSHLSNLDVFRHHFSAADCVSYGRLLCPS